MKLTFVLLTVGFLSVAAKGVSQHITFSGNSVAIESVLSVVEKQTGYVFMYARPVLKTAKPVSVSVRDMPLKKFLDVVFRSQPLEYDIRGKNIFISSRTTNSLLTDTTITVRGRIVNELGGPVIAAVVIKGTNRGVTSDADGNFKLSDVNSKATLVVTATNIEKAEIKLDGSSANVLIAVKNKVVLLDEVIFKGYYQQAIKTSTGSVSKVSSEKIATQPVGNPLQAAIGRMAGVQITQVGGTPGTALSINVRGKNSLRMGFINSPLYVVDGVPIESTPSPSINVLNIDGGYDVLNTINPDNIESIEVLKDADATSIYGSLGANGVVLITTKKGNTKTANFDVNFRKGIGFVTKRFDLLKTPQYLEMRKEAFENDGLNPQDWSFLANDILVWDQTRYTNWQDEVIGHTAHTTNIQAAVQGGSENSNYRISLGHYREGDVYIGDWGNKKTTVGINLSGSTANKKFKSTVSVNYGVDNIDLPGNLNGNFSTLALSLPPNAPAIFNPDGSLNWENSTFDNPFNALLIPHESRTNGLIANSVLDYQPIPGLHLKVNLGYNTSINKETILQKATSADPIYQNDPSISPFFRSTQTGSNSLVSWIAEPQIEFSKRIRDSRLDVIVGTSWRDAKNNSESIYATDYSSDALVGNVKAAGYIDVQQVNFTQYRYNAVFGRIGYSLKNRYILNATGRRDASSRFGPDKKFANFGSLAAAWVFSDESFVKDLPFLSFGKIKSSYGITGSDRIGDYQFYSTYSPTPYEYQIPSLTPTALGNADFSWELNRKLELALDLGLWNNKVNVSAAWYRNISTNQLVGLPLPAITGFNTIQFNLPATVRNTGWEFLIETKNIQSKKITWTTSVNLTIPRNKLLSFPNIQGSSFANTYVVGQPLSIFKFFNSVGVDPETGLYEFTDFNGSGSYSIVDRQIVKSYLPGFYGGFNSLIRYGGISLDFLIQFSKQNGFGYREAFAATPGDLSNQPASVMQRWQKPGDISAVQKFTTGLVGNGQSRYFNMQNSDAGFMDASFVRLKNVQLSYALPQSIAERIGLNHAGIYVQGQNLFTITPYDGWDADNATSRRGNIPALTMLAVGFRLNFN